MDDYIVHLVVLSFLLINFDQTVGLTYAIIALIDTVYYYITINSNVFPIWPIKRDTSSKLLSIVYSVGIYLLFVVLAYGAYSIATHSQFNLKLAFSSFPQIIVSTFSSTPILSDSAILKVFVWGVLIPFIETIFFFRFLPQWSLKAVNKPTPTPFSIDGQVLSGFIGVVFMLFHIVSKGIDNNPALLTTFVFGYVSMVVVLYFKQMTEALTIHYINNSYATLKYIGTNFQSVMGISMIAGLALFAWFLTYKEIPLVR